MKIETENFGINCFELERSLTELLKSTIHVGYPITSHHHPNLDLEDGYTIQLPN